MMQRAASVSGDLLGAIVAATRRIVDVRQRREPLARLAERAAARQIPAGRFRAAIAAPAPQSLRRAPTQAAPRIIAECKRRSPSRGVLRVQYDPAAIARGYERAGASAVSVLTEPTFFDGALEHLQAVRGAVNLPVLRKDFVVSEYQLLEARASGADAVLLIVAALDGPTLTTLHARATELGLDVLVEVHTAEELAIALDAGAKIVGVNNRDLRTLEVDVSASAALAARIPDGIVRVSESGLRTADDLIRLQQLGYDAFLIGERFMTRQDPGAELGDLLRRLADRTDEKGDR